ncbi:AAA family ATPase [Adhaeribacter radiodurans]|uniref:AAA family ATPase n=1 Tax=Adhaeribacter radiodurans TaxID=2745197 RepID=A0A7L7LCN3_9BACT|nr:AAA family ATPase [Adhaeribacter radiodurans]QMU30507.1 AAA family ATPase [Adhaeribacter radiodurans]
MRIDKLEIKSSWKNLEGFTVDFDEARDVAVLIGRNGSSKSNLLEALIWIFRNIDLKASSKFSYSIQYRINGSEVRIQSEVDQQARGEVNGKLVNALQLRDKWTPRYLVGYYSGTSDRFAELFEKHDNLALKETLEKNASESLMFRRFIYARPEHGLFALLSFYLSEDEEVMKFLEDLPRIEAFDSALLILHKPPWAPTNAKAEDFWGAKGPVRKLLESFRRNSLAPFSKLEPADNKNRGKREVMYLYLPDINALHSLAKEYGSDPRTFFQALDTMRISQLIRDVRVRVKIKGSSSAIHTRQLSEGEQQLLTVLGLMRFTRNEDSLYLLDEPDTHLNPAWGLEYLDKLRKIGGIEKRSHTILATHDPLLVSGLLKQEIRVMHRSMNSGVIAIEPEESPRGTGVAGVLTSELYGLESQLDKFSLRVLKRIYEVSLMKDYPLRHQHLKRLRKLVPGITPTDYSPDPYRNIAKLAYEQTLALILKSENNNDLKREAVDRLSNMLYSETNGSKL